MKLTLLVLILTCSVVRAQEGLKENFSNEEVEMQMMKTGEKIMSARKEVLQALDRIKDPKKQALYKKLFEKNEKAWSDFIETTALLQQPVYDEHTQPDIRYVRILGTDYAEFRIKQYQDFSLWIKQKE